MDEIPGTHSPFGSHLPADDIVLFVRTRNAASLRALVLDLLQTMDGVMSTHTVLVFDEL
jgi:DNA-binding Lrp family transcriptional regulator